jgi:sugar/nucleoside kinase (ribokinase family)
MYDVFGLGNAIVDTELRVDERFLSDQGIAKGHMTLVDTPRMHDLLAALGDQPRVRSSGGSAANTIVALQSLGYNTGYGCKVADDETGKFFLEHMAECGVDINTSASPIDNHSGQCLILITSDAERTMNTDLGISAALSMDDINFKRFADATYFYAEGYLSASPDSATAVRACRDAGRETGVATAISLSDPSMVEIFRDELTEMMGNGVELIFCNEEEALSWAKTDRIDLAITELKDISPEVYVTLGARGSIAVTNGRAQTARGYEATAVDTTGAGDIYAGACLAARLGGAEPVAAAAFANFCAAELVSHYGARLANANEYLALKDKFTG